MASIYNADVWCDDCANLIRKDLLEAGKVPTHPDDECSYDSDEFPKWADDDDASDSPTHCAGGADCCNAEELSDGTKLGMLFGSLTEDGMRYVTEAIREGGEISELWQEYFENEGYQFDFSLDETC